MTDQPPAQPEATTPRPAHGRRRRVQLSDTVKYARLSSFTAIIFGVLMALALIFVHSAPKMSASDAEFTAFYAGNSTVLVTVGIYLVPFSGIAFLWHMNATRLLIKSSTPSPSAIPEASS